MVPGSEVLDLNDDMGEGNEFPSEIPQIQVTDPHQGSHLRLLQSLRTDFDHS